MSDERELVILQAAQADLLEIYFQHGETVEAKIDHSLGLLCQQPNLGPVFEGDLHRLVVPGSPFGIFYFVYPTRVIVSAVLDLRQNPISDAELEKLETLPKLRWLYLEATDVTEDGLAALRDNLPDCHIEIDE